MKNFLPCKFDFLKSETSKPVCVYVYIRYLPHCIYILIGGYIFDIWNILII